MDDPALLQWCLDLPKVELHAHLNGSIRDEVVMRIVKRKSAELADLEHYAIPTGTSRNLKEAFDKIFSAIYRLTTDEDTVYEIATEVLNDFAADNVVYLELRTTPRERPALPKRRYVETVTRAIADAKARLPGMEVRLILTIDRSSDTLQTALDTVALASEFAAPAGPVVGVDLAGNPHKGDWPTFAPAFEAARKAGLRVTLHTAEIFAPAETEQMLQFRPDRVGHCYSLNEQLHELLSKHSIPVEVCITANIKCQTVDVVERHIFKDFHAKSHPTVLGTDDKGVFVTTLSREYALAGTVFRLSRRQLFDLALQAVDYIFDEEAKPAIREKFRLAETRLLQPE